MADRAARITVGMVGRKMRFIGITTVRMMWDEEDEIGRRRTEIVKRHSHVRLLLSALMRKCLFSPKR